jgi:aminoglycoside phosphotransferase family enzyme/predicted kinase
MDADLTPMVHALLAPERYGAGVTQVERLETHISWVFLAGDFAYKIKKPVKLAFLDFSSLPLRKHFCEEELRLNQRYSPDIYLAVVGLFNTAQDPQWQGRGEPMEYAVKMRRFAQTARLDQVCARGALQPQHMSDLARSVTAFHQAAARAPATASWGSAGSVLEQALQNFGDLQRMLADPASQSRLRALQAWTEGQHQQWAALMSARKQSGCVRECHGDLHLANLVLLDHKVHLFDCIEFNEDLRWIDVASELSFTYVDLLAHGQPGLACWFVNESLACSGDFEAAPLLRFYAVYRALVRAKVCLIQATQSQGSSDQALRYIALAERLAAPRPRRLWITHGVSGCGKTRATDLLLQQDPAASILRLRSDVERKRAAGLAAHLASGSGLNAGLYAPDTSAHTYAHLLQLAEQLLQANWDVVVDATFLQRAQRDSFRQLARTHGAQFSILAPPASSAQLRERILQRSAQGGDASEATLDVLAQQQKVLEALAADEPVWPVTQSAPS